MGSRSKTAAVSTTRSVIVGIPRGRNRPGCPALGICTRRTALGRSVLVLRVSASSPNHRSLPYASMSANVWASTPGAPPLAAHSR